VIKAWCIAVVGETELHSLPKPKKILQVMDQMPKPRPKFYKPTWSSQKLSNMISDDWPIGSVMSGWNLGGKEFDCKVSSSSEPQIMIR